MEDKKIVKKEEAKNTIIVNVTHKLYNMKISHGSTMIEVESSNKVLFNRLELAINHVLNEFDEKGGC